MKKFYVLAAATMMVASANAASVQTRSTSKLSSRIENSYVKEKTLTYKASEANHSATAPNKLNKPVKGEAFYGRPAGAMMATSLSGGYTYNNPIIAIKPNKDVTFTASDLDAYNWRYQSYNTTSKAYQWYTADTKSFIKKSLWGETDSVPTLTDGVTEYHYGGATDKTATAKGWAWLTAEVDLFEEYQDATAGIGLFGPKYFGVDRAGSGYGSVSISGAKDADGGKEGQWFGKNYSGWNAMGLYVEKPEYPYMLRSIFVKYSALELVSDGVINVKVYKVASRVSNSGSEQLDVVVGDLICEGSYTLVKDEASASGTIQVPFIEDFDGLEMEVTPTIEDEIFVVVSGYDSDAFANFTMSCAYDGWDEGFGQHGYMVAAVEGAPAQVIGLDHFFDGLPWDWTCTAPSVFLDLVNPFMQLHLVGDVPVRSFDADGNSLDQPKKTSTLSLLGNQVDIYSVISSEEMSFTLEDGSDLPEWLSVTAEDQMAAGETGELEFSGEVILTVEAAANTGVAREAKVKVAIPGDVIYLTVKQEGNGAPDVKGDVNGDGVVDIADVNAAIDMVLGLADNKPTADVNGDGVVDIADINAIIDIVLGL